MRKFLSITAIVVAVVAILVLTRFAIRETPTPDQKTANIVAPVRINNGTEITELQMVGDSKTETSNNLQGFSATVQTGETFVIEGREDKNGTLPFMVITPTLQMIDDQSFIVLSIERKSFEAGVESLVAMPRILTSPSKSATIESAVNDVSGTPVAGWKVDFVAEIDKENRISLNGSLTEY